MACSRRVKAAAIAAVAACGVRAAHADSATGVDSVLGNGFNPGQRGCVSGATEPISVFRTSPSRSPSGLLNPNPPAPSAARSTEAGWSITGCAEFGVLAGGNDEDSALFRTYRDLGGSAIGNTFWLGADNASQAAFFEASGGGLSRRDQYVGLRLGRYNDWTLSAFYNETPHVFSNNFRSLWSGVGSANLTLDNPTLVPGGQPSAEATQAAIGGALANTPYSTLELVRKKGGFSFNATLSESWKAFYSYSGERRKGARPFGAVFGGGDGGGNVEVPESIDYVTHELSAGASYVDAVNSLNVAVSASLFRNHIDTMTFQNPLTVTPDTIAGIGPNAFTQGRYDLYPDNDYYSAKADYSRSWPDWFNARMTASFALGSMRQNDRLIEPTTLSLSGATLNGIAAANEWNTTAALTRSSADARIDTHLVALSLALSPARALSLTGRVRYYATDNSTDYLACNPSTGQLGRLLNDGSGAAIVNVPAYLAARCDPAAIRALGIAPDRGDITLRNVPYQTTQQIYALAADWRVAGASNLAAEFEREEYHRQHREREKTWEDKLELTYSNRGFESTTLRASFEYAERRGSAYVTDPYRPFVSASLGPLPSTGNVATWIRNVDGFRKFDLADRTRSGVNLRANFALSETIDAGASYMGKHARYPGSDYGRNGREHQDAVSVEMNYQAASGSSLYGHYALQTGKMGQVGIQPVACVIGAAGVTSANFEQVCGAAGGPLYPRDRFWEVKSKDRSEVAGVGGRIELRWGVLDLDYVYSRGRTSIAYANGAGITLTPTQQTLVGTGWPDLKFSQSVLTASALVPLARKLSARLWLQLESGKVDDWHYAGVHANPVPAANAVYLDSGPERYRASLIGVLLRLEM